MNQRIFKTTLRLNLENEDERRALDYLRNIDRREYKSYSQAIAAAVNNFFDQKEKGPFPFLETQEREDAFLRKVEETVRRCLTAARGMNTQQTISDTVPSEKAGIDDMDAVALDFVNGL